MDAQQIRRLEPMLMKFLRQFDGCFARKRTREHFPVYVRGQLSQLERKSVEPIALAADVPVRTLQEFLTHLKWDANGMRQRLQQIVVRDHADPEAIGIIDETGWVKKGDKTPGVQRQYCGSVGKQENSILTVHLSYATDDFHCLMDGDLYLPESWDQDRARCREAGIPEDVVYRPKTEIALELYDRARANGVHLEWMTFDEWYGAKPAFLFELETRSQKFVGEIHKAIVAWIDPPQVTERPFHRGKRGRGPGRATPRLFAGSRKPQTVEKLARSHPALRDQPWQTWRIKDGQKGPIVWKFKHVPVFVKDERGLPHGPWHLLVGHNPVTGEIKYFLSNAPPDTPLKKMLRVAFSRWRIERCFEDGKGEVGLDHWEGRRWIGLQRHLILTAVSYLFLARACQELRGEKTGTHRLPSPHGHQHPRSIVVADSDITRSTHATRDRHT